MVSFRSDVGSASKNSGSGTQQSENGAAENTVRVARTPRSLCDGRETTTRNAHKFKIRTRPDGRTGVRGVRRAPRAVRRFIAAENRDRVRAPGDFVFFFSSFPLSPRTGRRCLARVSRPPKTAMFFSRRRRRWRWWRWWWRWWSSPAVATFPPRTRPSPSAGRPAARKIPRVAHRPQP